MKQEKKRTTLYLTEVADRWITEQATTQGISKNDVIQILINKEMEIGGVKCNPPTTLER